MSDQSVEQRLEELRSWYEASGPDHPGSDLEIFFTRIDASQERERLLVEMVRAQDDLLAAYRLGSSRGGSRAADRVGAARAALREVGALEEER